MRIRLIPLAIASAATSIAVVAAVALGAAFLPILKRVALGIHPLMGGAGVAVVIGAATALILAMHGSGEAKQGDPRSGARPDERDEPQERRRDR